MPMFDYCCNNCNEKFEELVPSSSTPDEEIECPNCHEHQASRLLSAPSISIGTTSFGGGGGRQGGSGFT